MSKREHVATGIRRDQYGYDVYWAGPDNRTRSKRFPPSTPIHQLDAWRKRMMADVRMARALGKEERAMPRSLKGWCYIYFVRAGEMVKIGRATDPRERVRNLQVGHHDPLTLVVAVPAHAATEAAIHERFKHLRQADGEWFRIDDELMTFIRQLQANINPIALLFNEVAPTPPPIGGK